MRGQFIISRRELYYLASLFLIFIFIRSLNFVPALNFSGDQGLFSLRAWDIWRDRQILLIGPSFSLNLDGRYAFQGSVIYYFQLIFLLMGGWDPVISSLLFVFFSGLMIIPLYFGIRCLSGRRSALFVSVIYTLFPYYIDYTRFLWNPNFQLSLTPLLILFMGLHYRSRRLIFLILSGFAAGIILQFHYQFLPVIPFLAIIYLLASGRWVVYFVAGFLLGFSPIIVFELRHGLYNLQTIILFLSRFRTASGGLSFSLSPHYFLSLSLVGLVAGARWLRHRHVSFPVLILGLLIVDLLIYAPSPAHGFRMSPDWSYPDEFRVHRLITADGLSDFNVVNLIYDTKASVQKYLLVKEGKDFIRDDYNTNSYLYVLASPAQIFSTGSYEVVSFAPYRIVSIRPINAIYSLYLLRRSL